MVRSLPLILAERLFVCFKKHKSYEGIIESFILILWVLFCSLYKLWHGAGLALT